MAATATKPAAKSDPSQQTVDIVERLDSSSRRRVDAEHGVIYGVKLLGLESKNGRVYPAQVLRRAVHLYEGAKVNVNHPSDGKPDTPRSYEDRIGVLRSARVVEGSGGGIYGDFHYNPKHRLAEQIAWDADNNPEALGFSHNATLRYSRQKSGGKAVVEEIVGVRHVDLVADPATTNSIFEGENMPEATPDPAAAGAGAATADAMGAAFEEAVIAAVRDKTLNIAQTIAKIKDILKAQEKLMGTGSVGGSSGGGDGGGDAGGDDAPAAEHAVFKQQLALLTQQLEHYKAKEQAQARDNEIRSELEAAGFDLEDGKQCSELFVNQLKALESKEKRAPIIADRAALLGIVAATESNAGTGGKKPTGSNGTANPAVPASPFSSKAKSAPASSALEQIDTKTFVQRLKSSARR